MDMNQQRDNLKHLAVIILVLHQVHKGETENDCYPLVVLTIPPPTRQNLQRSKLATQVNEYSITSSDLCCSGILSKSSIHS